MTDLKIDEIGLKVGLEIHQQLATNKKLFCSCLPLESEEYTSKFSRRLRASKSEMGQYDPAALFENIKSKTITYYANSSSSCLVEKDEEPPHDLDDDAKHIALVIASALQSNIFTEIYPMRKMVVDGSNTSGFQRTMLVSQGGTLDALGVKVEVQSICLEEDAAKLLGDKGDTREYSLDRLGVPLIEIALAPVSAGPAQMRKVALALGRLLRTTKKVTRGLGSIRQDVNVSVDGSGVVEVKGVQQLDQLEKVVQYEATRQHGLLKIAQKLKEKNPSVSKKDIYDITTSFANCESAIIQKAIKSNAIIKVVKVQDFAGMFSFSPYDGIRLGKELGQLVRFFGIGGIFHSDELPNYGINQKEIDEIKKITSVKLNDGFFIIAADKSKIDFAIESIINRITKAIDGVPAETRLATQTGETVFLRPRPGASRMYPETDIPPVLVTSDELQNALQNIPKSWDDSIKEIQEKYELNPQLAEQIFDSEYIQLFIKICSKFKVSPTFVVSTLCSTITSLQRKGLDVKKLDHQKIETSFELLSNNQITKESIEIIYESVMSNKSQTIQQAVKNTLISTMSDRDIHDSIDKIINDNLDLIANQKERSVGPLMGTAMKSLRGKADGQKINQFLQEKIRDVLNKKK